MQNSSKQKSHFDFTNHPPQRLDLSQLGLIIALYFQNLKIKKTVRWKIQGAVKTGGDSRQEKRKRKRKRK